MTATASLLLLHSVANPQGTYMPVMALMYLTGQYLTAHVPAWLPFRTAWGAIPSALPFALAVHLNGWAWQFFGHFKFEGRAPALFSNLTQALVTAPFFVHVEALFFFFNCELPNL